MKKLLFLCLCLIVIFSVAACQSDKGVEPPPKNSATSESNVTALPIETPFHTEMPFPSEDDDVISVKPGVAETRPSKMYENNESNAAEHNQEQVQ